MNSQISSFRKGPYSLTSVAAGALRIEFAHGHIALVVEYAWRGVVLWPSKKTMVAVRKVVANG